MEQTTMKPVIPIVESPDTFNLIIPREVHRKIKAWCAVSPDTEWSGTLFYAYSGNFKDKNLKITVKDFLVSDVGSSGYTEYDVKPEIVSYMIDNELLDCKCGILHSHNHMAKL